MSNSYKPCYTKLRSKFIDEKYNDFVSCDLDMFSWFTHVWHFSKNSHSIAINRLQDQNSVRLYERERSGYHEDITEAGGTRAQASEHLCVSILSPLWIPTRPWNLTALSSTPSTHNPPSSASVTCHANRSHG